MELTSTAEHYRARLPGMVDYAAVASAEPLGIPDLGLWLRADAITGVSNGAALATWPDSSANGNSATQGTAGAQPIYNTNQVNGLPAVFFDNSNDGMLTTWSVSSGGVSVVVVARTSQTSGAHRAVQGSSNWSVRSNGTIWQSNSELSTMNGPSVVAGQWTYHILTQDSMRVVWHMNGRAVGSAYKVWFPGTIGLGVSGFQTTEPFGGDIAEVIGYSRVLTSDEMGILYRYIRGKYALS